MEQMLESLPHFVVVRSSLENFLHLLAHGFGLWLSKRKQAKKL